MAAMAFAGWLASLAPGHAQAADINLENWQSYAPMAEQGAVCGAFAGIMSMQTVVDAPRGQLWGERRHYAGSVIRKAAELEGLPNIDESAIDNLLNRYSMWLLNHLSTPQDAAMMNDDARKAATAMIRDVCIGLFTKADTAIIKKFPDLAAFASATPAADNQPALAAAKTENDRLVAQKEALQSELDQTNADLTATRAQLAATQSSMRTMEREQVDIDTLTEQLSGLRARLTAMEGLETERTALQEEIATLRQLNDDLLEERDELDAELNAAVLALLTPDDADDLERILDAANGEAHNTGPAPETDMATQDSAPASETDTLPVDEFALGSSESLVPPAPKPLSTLAAIDITPPVDDLMPAAATPLFSAQLGAFRQRDHAEAEISMLLETFADDLAVAELTVTPATLPDGKNVFRILTQGMPADTAAQICEALWQRMVGCLLKAVP